MKRTFWLILFLFLANFAFAQKGQHVIGLQLGSNVSTQGLRISQNYEFNAPVISPSGGIYYDWNVSSQLGINASANYRRESQKFFGSCIGCFSFSEPIYNFTYHYLELPVNLTLNLNNKETTSWKTYLIVGYTFSYLLSAVSRDPWSGFVFDDLRYYGVIRDKHYLNLGIEVRHNLSDKYSIGLSPFARILVSEEIEQSYLGFTVKFGRII